MSDDISTHYMGVVGPVHGRWVWPFKHMKVGDYFLVRFEDRNPEEVRHLASVRAAQRGIRISVTKFDPAHPHMVKVMRIPDDAPAGKRVPEYLNYEQFRGLAMRQYNLDADALPWGKAIEPGERETVSAIKCGNDARKLVHVTVGGDPYAVELGDNFVAFERLARGQSLEDWKARKLAAMLE